MVRWSWTLGLLLVGILVVHWLPRAAADEPLSAAERAKLEKQAAELTEQADQLHASGKPAQAVSLARKAVAICERLYPATEYPDGHLDLATSLNNLGFHLQELQEPAKALPYFEKALAMYQRLYPPGRFPDGHADVADGLNNLGLVLEALGKPAKARPHFEQALAMRQRLYPPERFPDGHLNLATSLYNLGAVLHELGEPASALPYFEKALAMYQHFFPPKRFPDGHPYVALTLNNLGFVLLALGQPAKALLYCEQALTMLQRLYPPERFKDRHPYLARCLNSLGGVLEALGEPAKARPYYEQALAMRQRLYPPKRFPDGHRDLATSLNNLGGVLQELGEPVEALPYYEKALAMNQRLYPPGRFPDGHPDLARSFNNLGALLHHSLREPAKALPYYEKALAMRQRLYPPEKFKHGHRDLAISLNNLGAALHVLGEPARALRYREQALAMLQRLYPPERFPDGHPDLALTFNNLGAALHVLGEPAKALRYFEKALAMYQRLYPPKRFPDGHRYLALTLNNLGRARFVLGQPAKALTYCEKALTMTQRLILREIAGAPEAQALAFLGSFPRNRDAYLATCLYVPDEPVAEVYTHVWPFKGLLLRFVTRRHQAALVAATDSPKARDQWERLQAVRRQLNHLLVEPGRDPTVRDRRLAQLSDEQEQLERDLAQQLPELDRQRRLAPLGPADLAQRLARGTAFIDFVRHARWEKGKFNGYHYQAFVLAPGRDVRRVDLGPAEPLDEAVTSWRRAISRQETSQAPQRLKEQLWDKLAAELPAGTKAVYLCPEGDLARLPWAALPGSKPGTVLLEDLGVAVVPSGAWLLEQLLYPQQDAGEPATLLAAGAIDYGKPPAGGSVEYEPLKDTDRELKRVLDAFAAAEVSGLRGAAATPAALKEKLPQVRYAHFATHGYFDAEGLAAERRRAREQLEKWAYHADQPTAPVGLGAKNPLGYVGLALAGANDPGKAGPDGGILTGLGIVDLRLEQLRLCVLSACETGLGDLTEGEGVIGLQRAFHVAGCPNVIGSLWAVDDAATAALMAQFYHELRVNKLTSLEALRAAQLTIYRHPERIPALAGERGKPALEAAAKLGPAAAPANEKPATAPTRLWAAFVLSGVGR
jgi:CHAT domain-containing protein/Tfp pilus assembly protein PilF